jgi:hypothetical protein
MIKESEISKRFTFVVFSEKRKSRDIQHPFVFMSRKQLWPFLSATDGALIPGI